MSSGDLFLQEKKSHIMLSPKQSHARATEWIRDIKEVEEISCWGPFGIFHGDNIGKRRSIE